MKEINTSTIEQALATYTENVSPSQENLKAILSHIPEKKNLEKGRAIRSPYMWLELTELVMLCSLMLMVLPSFSKIINDPFYQVDKEVQIFEKSIQLQDSQENLFESTL